MSHTDTNRMALIAPLEPRFDEILTAEALAFLTALHDRFAVARHESIRSHAERLTSIASGQNPDFLPETARIRGDPSWRVIGPGPGMRDCPVEVLGPTDRESTVTALGSGADVWVADHADALSPTWANVIGGQITLFDAIRGRIDIGGPQDTERHSGQATPTFVFRPRGMHRVEKHLRYITPLGVCSPVSASLVDFGLYVFHNATELLERGQGPYFVLPNVESHLGARLWDEIFAFSERFLAIPQGSIRTTVLIDTVTAALEMDEILYELRDHCSGLHAGRWDYLFSIIKTFRTRGRCFLLPDREQVSMTAPFMRAYRELLVATCHRRGAHAIGSLSANVPRRSGQTTSVTALSQTGDDAHREVSEGFDGTCVAHPNVVEVARAEFTAAPGDQPIRRRRKRAGASITSADLLDLRIPDGQVTGSGITQNVTVALSYLERWLAGVGVTEIDGITADAASAEFSRSLLWQWINQGAVTADGIPVVRERVEWCINSIRDSLPRSAHDHRVEAAELLREVVLGEGFPPYLTVHAYARHLDNSAIPVLAV